LIEFFKKAEKPAFYGKARLFTRTRFSSSVNRLFMEGVLPWLAQENLAFAAAKVALNTSLPYHVKTLIAKD
jgi:hypothetical protein